jgi:hypothetical protein
MNVLTALESFADKAEMAIQTLEARCAELAG